MSSLRLKTRVRDWLRGPLEGEEREAFAAESVDANVRRLRVLLPLMVLLHAVHIAVFHESEAARAAMAPNLARWRQDLVLAHAATLVFALTLTLALPSLARTRAARFLAPTCALGYLVHGAVIAGIDQLSAATVTVFIGYALGVAVVVALTPVATLVVYAGGLASFVAAIEAMQPSPTARLMMLPNGFSTSAVSSALALLLYAARRRDFAQRLTIGEQRAELAALNVGLEQRVRAQVSEIVERAREIETLNTQLQAQVRTRSTELSMALAKLARDRREDGRLRSGVVLGERFVVDALLGEGGMGSVYSGTDRSTGARVAIKVIQASSAQQLDALHRFLREAGTAAKVNHAAVVRMLHVDVSADGVLFQVQELVDGETLHSRLRDQRAWDCERVARLGAVLCDALAAAHAVGVVHRDVKPGNVMLTKTAPGLKLLDFGISKVFRDGGRDASSGSGKILGTPAYMAPEHLAGLGKLTDRADVYAAGVIFFRMLSGKFPFDDASTRDAILRKAIDPPPDVRTIAPSVPAELATLVARCLDFEPTGRPRAIDLARELTSFADAHGAPPPEIIARDVSSLAPVRAASEAVTVALGAGSKTPRM